MSSLYLCNGEISAMPFYIEMAGLNIYSPEELGYFIKENIDLIDESFMSRELMDWVKGEIKSSVLSQKIEAAYANNNVYGFIESILGACNILSREEIRDCLSVMKQYTNCTAFERRKIKADNFVKKEYYLSAIREYEKLLEMDELKNYSKSYAGKVWNNLGCAYAGMFQFDFAYDCFLRAFQLTGDEKARTFALRSDALRGNADSMDPTGKIIVKNIDAKMNEMAVTFPDSDTILSELKEEYRRISG
ncbi:MAG: hypothetical protein K6F37_06865 [Lachnospiraceae bacterium]|nr:hypothetical protein [Lachnospiraceae bacterium]